LIVHTNNHINDSTTRHEATWVDEINTFDILITLGKEADLVLTSDTCTSDAEIANRSDLVNMWNTIKQDRQRHMQMLRDFGKRSKGRKSNEIVLANSERKAEWNDLYCDYSFLFLLSTSSSWLPQVIKPYIAFPQVSFETS
jgi:hypothetical protein